MKWMCRLLQVQASGFYAWRHLSSQTPPRGTGAMVSHIRAAHSASHGTYGSPRIHRQLRGQGIRASRRRIAALMRENGISGNRKRRFVRTTQSLHNLPVADDLLGRDFSASEPNQKWVTDITYLTTPDGWVYLASIMDLFSRRIVGWAMDVNMEVGLTLCALQRAVKARNPPPGLVHHSDRGSQYASKAYQSALKEHGMICSMSRKGECWDNAPAESVFGRIKEELVYRHKWESQAQVMAAVDRYLNSFYNPRRLHSSLDFRSPLEYELAEASRQPFC